MNPKLFTKISIWLLLALGSLKLGMIEGTSVNKFAERVFQCESLCGEWGCYPPIQALASLHILWGLVLFPLAWAFSNHFGGRTARQAAWAVMFVGAIAAVMIVEEGLRDWYFDFSDPYFRRFIPQRAIYSLSNETLIPAIQLQFAGLMMIARTPSTLPAPKTEIMDAIEYRPAH